jgi:hypothetical protein
LRNIHKAIILSLALVALVLIGMITVIPTVASSTTYYYYAFVPPAEWQTARDTAKQLIQELGTNLLTGLPAGQVGVKYDLNNDTVVNIADVYIILKQAGLINIDPPKLPGPVASALLSVLEALYGPQLVNYPTLDGRVYLLYMLGYLPYQ